MSRYEVIGHANVICSMEVEADSQDEAIEIANNEFGSLTNYIGMGGGQHLLGVLTSEDNRCVLPDTDPEFDDAIVKGGIE